jgi:hypothetical protein
MNGCYLLISDIHADIGALEAILRLAADEAFTGRYGPVERIFNVGDVVERGYHPCEVIDRLKGLDNLTSVLGNHDEAFVWSAAVSGSDARSATAHEACCRRGGWDSFFAATPEAFVERAERLYVVHGGPLEPGPLCNAMTEEALAWLSSRTWQRLSRAETGCFDMNGYHYTPEQAFSAVRESLAPGFAIVCGHEHAETAFAEHDGSTEDVLYGLDAVAVAAGGRRVEEKAIAASGGHELPGAAGPRRAGRVLRALWLGPLLLRRLSRKRRSSLHLAAQLFAGPGRGAAVRSDGCGQEPGAAMAHLAACPITGRLDGRTAAARLAAPALPCLWIEWPRAILFTYLLTDRQGDFPGNVHGHDAHSDIVCSA